MSIEQLADMDAQYRRDLLEAAIRDTERGLEVRRSQAGRTDLMQRHLENLKAKRAA